MSANGVTATDAVRDTIYRSCLLLDDQKWGDWLDLCADDFHYKITAWSPEINYDMTYFQGGRRDLSLMTELLPKHNSDHSPFRRHTTVYMVDVDKGGKTATAVSSLVVYQNLLDGINSHLDAGESHLFLIGKYFDKFKIEKGKATFLEREVRLDTRRLDKGTHWLL